METIITGLLSQFERGKLSRRELVQSLCLAASGGYALRSTATAAAQVPPSAAPLPPTAWLDHISYGVADYGRSRDFYADLLGWGVTADDAERGEARLRIGEGLGDIIIRNSTSTPERGPTGVVNHICWGLDTYDTEGVREELESRGLDPRRDQGGRYDPIDSYHVLDPDGWDLQLAVRLPA